MEPGAEEGREGEEGERSVVRAVRVVSMECWVRARGFVRRVEERSSVRR
jgi:hypothetical protein